MATSAKPLEKTPLIKEENDGDQNDITNGPKKDEQQALLNGEKAVETSKKSESENEKSTPAGSMQQTQTRKSSSSDEVKVVRKQNVGQTMDRSSTSVTSFDAQVKADTRGFERVSGVNINLFYIGIIPVSYTHLTLPTKA